MMRFLKYLLVTVIVLGVLAWLVHYRFKSHTNDTYAISLKHAPYDVIIIPGSPYDSLEPNYMLKVRMHWAKYLFDKGITRNIIFSGAAVHTPFVEGICMKAIADSMGIPLQFTFAETKALHGIENISLGLEMAKNLGFKKTAVATDPFQSYFLSNKVEVTNPSLAFLPLSVDSMEAYDRALPRINAKSAFVENFVRLKER
jgi:hypothetical protein